MDSNTFVRAEIWTIAQTDHGTVVLIRPIDTDLLVPVFVNNYETQSILIGIGNLSLPRPLTHDLLISLINCLDLSLVRVEIYELLDNVFYSRVIVDNDGSEIRLEARPADAIALAVRTKSDVFLSEEIIEQTSIPLDSLEEDAREASLHEENEDGARAWEDLFKNVLSPEMEQELERQLEEQNLELEENARQNELSNEKQGLAPELNAQRKAELKAELSANPERIALQEELEKAVEIEDYERAAVIRDKLKEMI